MMERSVLVISVVEELTLLQEDQTNLLNYGVSIQPQVCGGVCVFVRVHVCVCVYSLCMRMWCMCMRVCVVCVCV